MGELAEVATEWMDQYWDPAQGLLWNMDGSYDEIGPARTIHLVAQSAWYAAALLLRGASGDEGRAVRTIEAILDCQYDAPDTDWHATFARFLETPEPKPGAVMWIDYDPNWRQFVGTTFELLLHPDQPGAALEKSLQRRMRAAVAKAVDGEPPSRVAPTYSNIALMRAWLEVEHGRAGAEEYARQVVDAFDAHGTFAEYNSPTYYGIDLYALALWRDHSSSAQLREWGERIEAALWRDVARWYHPELRNLCGPWSRSYGMDMQRYVSLLGIWMWPLLGRERAPFPAPGVPLDHSHDLSLGPLVDHLGARVPDDATVGLTTFQGPHHVEQVITSDPPRVATGWLADSVMLGGESGELRASGRGQYHPATLHWRLPEGGVGWLRVVHNGPVRATASESVLDVRLLPHHRHGPQAPAIHISTNGGSRSAVEVARSWRLPGIDLALSAAPETVERRDGATTVARFPLGTDRIEIRIEATPG